MNSAIKKVHFINDKVNKIRYLFFGESNERSRDYLILRTFSGLDGVSEWKGIIGNKYLYPEIVMIETDDELKLKFYDNNPDYIKNKLKEIFSINHGSKKLPEIIDHQFLPNKESWFNNVDKCYQEFDSSKFKKLVMSRKVEMTSKSNFSSKRIFEELSLTSKNSFDFFFTLDGKIFFGSTPETLFKRKNNTLYTESLAGTRKRGENEEEDLYLENELINDPKERSEQKFVTDEIVNRLNGISKRINKGNTTVKKLAKLQHLHNDIEVELKDGISNDELLELMHPTPAVGSLPLKNGQEKIREIENYDRGLYAGVISINIDNESINLVGIRSALSIEEEKKLYLYSGAGIVKGSIAEKEWMEINNKLNSFLSILNYDFKE